MEVHALVDTLSQQYIHKTAINSTFHEDRITNCTVVYFLLYWKVEL